MESPDKPRKSIQVIRDAIKTVDNRLSDAAATAQTFNRATTIIICTFCVYVLGTGGWVIYAASHSIDWREAFSSLLDLLKTALLPIASTALGFYIAQRQK
jgi:hypothetical protein